MRGKLIYNYIERVHEGKVEELIDLFNKVKVKAVGILLVVSLIFLMSGCVNQSAKGEIVAKVNGDSIYKEDFEKDFNIYKNAVESKVGPEIWKKLEEEAMRRFLDKLIIEKIISQEAEKLGLKVTDEEVDKEIKNYISYFENEEKFKEFLKQSNITEEYFRKEIKKEILISKYKEEVLKDIEIPIDEAKKYYEDNIDSFRDYRVRARHILVKTEDEAKEILKQLKNGKDFAELAKEKSICPSASKGGDLGYIGKDSMLLPEFKKAALSLEPGQISDIVKTEKGYHIIKVEDKIDKLYSFDEVKDDIIKWLKDKEYDKKLKELRENADVETFLE